MSQDVLSRYESKSLQHVGKWMGLFRVPIRKGRRILAKISEWEEADQKKLQCVIGDDVVLSPASRIHNYQSDRDAISIGSHSRILGELTVVGHGGSITVGNWCYVGEGTRIWSGVSIQIGNRVLISHNVNIHDTISHSLSAASRHQHFKDIVTTGHPRTFDDLPGEAPIVIEDDVWLGFNSTVLKGVTIGRGAVVGAAAVVTKDVEPFSIVVGNPARAIGAAKP